MSAAPDPALGLSAPEVAVTMGRCGATVRCWLKRFNERGLQRLEEDMRSGRQPTYSAEERSAVITATLSRPAELGCRLHRANWLGRGEAEWRLREAIESELQRLGCPGGFVPVSATAAADPSSRTPR